MEEKGSWMTDSGNYESRKLNNKNLTLLLLVGTP
jgi:hypothetical protein